MYDLIVIGAGPGGYEAAIHAGRMGKKVALFEKNSLGGVCLNVGCIPTKTLLNSAHLLTACEEAGLYGVKTSGASLDLGALQERKNRIIRKLIKGIDGLLKSSGVEVILAEAVIKEKGVVESGGKKYSAANILIATGSRPAVLPVPGINSEQVLDSTGILKLTAIPQALIIIGAGAIGLEFASFFAAAGAEVTVIEMLPEIAPLMDREIAKRLRSALKKRGVSFNLSSRVTRIAGGTVYFTDKKGVEQSAQGEWILNAAGRQPVLEGLGLENINLEITPQGIATSPRGMTSTLGIWACGDVTGRWLLAHVAAKEGVVAVNNMFGKKERMSYEAIPSVIYSFPEVAAAGKTEEDLKEANIAYRKASVPMAVSGRYLIEHENQSGTVKILFRQESDEILGIHMLGGRCSELIFGAALMMKNKMRAGDVGKTVFPHPTVSEALKAGISAGFLPDKT